MAQGPIITTDRFVLRPLTVEDATPEYLGWFSGPNASSLTSASQMRTLEDLRDYIAARANSGSVLFLGIFTKEANRHVGNLKYEPVDSEKGYAVVGIFVGDPDLRGCGVASEVIAASARWLKENRSICEIVLGVATSNHAAIRAYEKTGFRRVSSRHMPDPPEGSHRMVLVLCPCGQSS